MEQNGTNDSKQSLLALTDSQSPDAGGPVAPKSPAASNTARYAGLLAAGLIVGVLIAGGWGSLRKPTGALSTATTTAGGMSAAEAGSGSTAALTIESPQKAGKRVEVAHISVNAPTWVVVYEDRSGKPGNALGARLFFAGQSSGAVDLLRATTAGTSYLAVKQADNGDRKFSLKGDPYLSEGGEVRWVKFEVQ